MKKILTVTALLIGLLTACGEKIQTVEWYIAHPEEMKKESAKCRLKSFEEMMKDKHCQVVEKAVKQAFDEQQRNAPSTKFKFQG